MGSWILSRLLIDQMNDNERGKHCLSLCCHFHFVLVLSSIPIVKKSYHNIGSGVEIRQFCEGLGIVAPRFIMPAVTWPLTVLNCKN